ncbi:MAG: hypothetical protein D6798_16520 [Deltaproteobacteria bacterium]|nr:MAG: hypothetical protein D6798_16520 [Deltaproteobacteria bacterium]
MGTSLVEFGVALVLAYGLPLALWTLAVRPRRQRIARLLEPLELSVRVGLLPDRAVARGMVDGLAVQVRYRDMQRPPPKDQPWGPPVAWCEVRIDIPSPLPEGLRVRSMNLDQHLVKALGAMDIVLGDERLDDLLRIAGEDEAAVRALLLDPVVRRELRAVASHAETRLDITGQRLTLTRQGQSAVDPVPAYDVAVSLATALGGAAARTWREFALDRGLRFSAGRGPGDLLIEGELEGVPVRVRMFARRGGRSERAMVEAVFRPKLPGGLRLLPRRERRSPDSGSPSTGNPVLDSVADMGCTDIDAARGLLSHEALIEPLMEVLHGSADAQVLPGGVAVRVDRWDPVAVDAALQAVVRLARAFREAMG